MSVCPKCKLVDPAFDILYSDDMLEFQISHDCGVKSVVYRVPIRDYMFGNPVEEARWITDYIDSKIAQFGGE